MTYKKLLLPVFAAIMLATSHQSDAMDFSNKKGLFGVFLGGIVIGFVIGEYIWPGTWLPRIPRPFGRTPVVVPTTTTTSYGANGTTSKKPTFDEVNELVKQLGPNMFVGVNIGHNAPEGCQTWKDKVKHSLLVLDLTNGLVVRTHNKISWCQDLNDEITQEGDTFKVLRKNDKDAYIAFDTQNNEAKAIGMNRSFGFGKNSMKKLRTYQIGQNL